MIIYSNEKHTVQWLIKQVKQEKIDFSILIQRNEVWEKLRKSNLIAAILVGIPLESLLFEEVHGPEGKPIGYKGLDGRQRTSSINSFVNNEFAIDKGIQLLSEEFRDTEVGKVFEETKNLIIGKTFSELPDELQDTLLDYELQITICRPLTEAERELVYFMRNQQKPLSKIEISRVIAGEKLLKSLAGLINHDLVEMTISESGRNSNIDLQLIWQLLMVELEEKPDFDGKHTQDFVTKIRTSKANEQVYKDVLSIMDYVSEALKKKVNRIHVPILYKTARFAVNNNVDSGIFSEWINEFFGFISSQDKSSNEYVLSTHAGANKSSSILKRIDYMKKSFIGFMKNKGVDINE